MPIEKMIEAIAEQEAARLLDFFNVQTERETLEKILRRDLAGHIIDGIEQAEMYAARWKLAKG